MDDMQLPLEGLQPEATPVPGQEEVAPNPLLTLAMTEEQAKEWWDDIQQAERRITDREQEWDILMAAYMPTVTKGGEPESLNSNFHFRNVHTKLANIFYKLPELHLEPLQPMKDVVAMHPVAGTPITAEDAVPIKQAVLNAKLGRKGVNGARLMNLLIQDALQWAGIACVKVGYSVTMKTVPMPVMGPALADEFGNVPLDPATGMPQQVPQTDPVTGEPMMQEQQVPIYEDWYMKRFSPKKLLLPSDLTSGLIDDEARFIGHKSFLTKEEVNSAFQIDYDLEATSEDDRIYKDPKDSSTVVKKKIAVYELFARASKYRSAEQPHPKAIDHIVFIEGIKDRPVVYRPSPDQTFDELGKLTPDSIETFPIRVLYLRDMPDSPFPPSDAAFVNSQVKNLNTHMQQSVRLRDAAIAKMGYDEEKLTPDEVKRIKNGQVGDWIALTGGALAEGMDKIVGQITTPVAARDDFRLAGALKANMDETLGIDAHTAGIMSDQRVTATEISESSKNSGQRMGMEQLRAIDFWLGCVEIYDVLLQRYATQAEYILIVGQDGTKRMQLWNNKVIAGKYAYDIKPDSQLHIDAARDRQQTLAYYKETAPDPMTNRYPVLRKLAGLFGLDPGVTVNDPQVTAAIQAQQAAQQTASDVKVKEAGRGPEGGERAHRATGGAPNAPEPGQPPNTARPNA